MNNILMSEISNGCEIDRLSFSPEGGINPVVDCHYDLRSVDGVANSFLEIDARQAFNDGDYVLEKRMTIGTGDVRVEMRLAEANRLVLLSPTDMALALAKVSVNNRDIAKWIDVGLPQRAMLGRFFRNDSYTIPNRLKAIRANLKEQFPIPGLWDSDDHRLLSASLIHSFNKLTKLVTGKGVDASTRAAFIVPPTDLELFSQEYSGDTLIWVKKPLAGIADKGYQLKAEDFDDDCRWYVLSVVHEFREPTPASVSKVYNMHRILLG